MRHASSHALWVMLGIAAPAVATPVDTNLQLWLDGADLRHRPLAERKSVLGELLPEDTGPLYKILTLEEHGRALFSAIKKMDLEGIVAKRKADPYSPTTAWYKIKNPGYTQGDGRGELFRPRERRRAQRVDE